MFSKSGLLPQVLGGGEGKGKGNHTSSPPPQTQSEPLAPSGVQQLSLQLRTTSCVPAAGQRSARQAEASLLLGGAQSQHPPQVSQDQVLHAARLLGASQSSGFWELRSGEPAAASALEAEALWPGARGVTGAPRGPQVPGQSGERVSVDEAAAGGGDGAVLTCYQ